MIRITYMMNNPICICDKIEDIMTGIKLKKMILSNNFKSLDISYILIDDNNYNIVVDVYNTILKFISK